MRTLILSSPAVIALEDLVGELAVGVEGSIWGSEVRFQRKG